MTKQEVIALMAIVRTGYPEYYRTQSDVSDAVTLWADILADQNAVLIGKALRQFMAMDEKGYPPKVGQLIALAKEIRTAELREQELARSRLPEPEPERVQMPVELREKFDAMLERMKG
jgi:hypothetical protein